ncbi:MAG TPA: acetoin utilization AcuB family protein [Candidatus Dormibacteraeota bacterium]|nr:acetoin utilization AcuB family protein [Candidatus Dormibacteraeota bacterium]
MLVEDIMKRNVITLPPTASIHEALALLRQHHIRHIPIIDEEDHLVGIISDRDIRDALPSIFENESDHTDFQKSVQFIMSYPVITVHPLDFIEEIARIFYDEEFASLPVVSNNKLVGLITEKDMLYTLIQLTGTHVQGSRIEIKVPNKPGVLPKVTAFFGKRNLNIISVLIYPDQQDPHFQILVFRFETMNPLPIMKDLQQAGYHLLWPNDVQGLS